MRGRVGGWWGGQFISINFRRVFRSLVSIGRFFAGNIILGGSPRRTNKDLFLIFLVRLEVFSSIKSSLGSDAHFPERNFSTDGGNGFPIRVGVLSDTTRYQEYIAHYIHFYG